MKRWISSILSVVLLLGLLPTTALAAEEKDIPNTGLYINKDQTDIDQIIGTYKAGEGSVTVAYDSESETVSITMNNAALAAQLAVAGFDTNVEVIGTNSIESEFPLYVDKCGLTVTGNGELDIQSSEGYALYGQAGISITNATVTAEASGDWATICAGDWDDVPGTITIDGASVTADSTDSNGLYAALGDIIIRNNSSVKAESHGDYPAFYADGDIQIESGSKVEVVSKSVGILSPEKIEISGSEVKVKSEYAAGIFTPAGGSIEISDSTVTAEGYYCGLQKDAGENDSGSITIKNSVVNVSATGDENYLPSGIYTGNNLVVEKSQVYAESTCYGIFIWNEALVSDSWIQAENGGVGLAEGENYTSTNSVTLDSDRGWVTGNAVVPEDVVLKSDYDISIPEGGTLTIAGKKVLGGITATINKENQSLLLPAGTVIENGDGTTQTIGEGKGSIKLDGVVTDNTEYKLTLSAPSFEPLIAGYSSTNAGAITITNTGNSTPNISIVIDSSNFTVESGNGTIEANSPDTSWKIRPNAGLNIGTYTGTISLLCNGIVIATAQVSVQVKSGGSSSGNSSGSSSPSTYAPDIKQPAEGGTVTVSPAKPKLGDDVVIKPVPDTGYEVDKITVTGKDGKPVTVTKNPDGTYSFTQPSGTVKVEVSYRPIEITWNNPFADVSEGAWYYDAVRYVSVNGLMNGYGNGLFGPNDNLTRAQFAQILFNREGRPSVNYLLQFEDVASGAWYTEAIRWATSQGIVSGYGNGRFWPNDNITREQLAVMLWRYAGSPAATEKELHFTDTDKISHYALDALRWAVENGIINGYGNGQLGPNGLATRAQVAQMLKIFFLSLY